MPLAAPRALALLLCAAALLAGCVSEEPAATTQPREETVLVTETSDNSALASGDMGWHLHDYWNGQTRRTAANAEYTTGGWNCNGCDDIALRFRGDRDQIVPLGTAQIEVEITWTTEGEQLYGSPELWVKRANERERAYVAAVENGVPIVFNTTNDEADPPHQTLSRWEFFLVLPAVAGEARTAGEFQLYADAIRGLEIPLFPPHPDHWGGATEIALFEESVGPLLQRENVEEGSRMCEGACLGTHVSDDGVIIPWDATEVVVTLTYDVGIPATLGVRSHGADAWEMTPAREEIAGPLERVFRIPVTPETGDSPYAKQSLWEVQVWIDQPAHERVFGGGYTLSAVARK